MSADNWTECPLCRIRAEEEAKAAKKKADDSYGKVPSGTYLELLNKSKEKRELEDTLREDYSIGIGPDGFSVSYSGACQACAFRHEYSASVGMDELLGRFLKRKQ